MQSSIFKAVWILGGFLLAMVCLIKIDDWASPGVEIGMVAGILLFVSGIFYAGQKRKA